MGSEDEKLAVANAPTAFKIRIHSQAFVLRRRKIPLKQMQRTKDGLILEVDNWYDEFPLGEFAVNHNGDSIPIKTVKEMLGNLGSTVMKSLQLSGLIKW